MLFAFLDEFGHQGPFVHRQDKVHNTSPVFGLAGLVLPEENVRPFSKRFLEIKRGFFAEDIERAHKQAYNWEKKGSEIFRPKSVRQYQEVRRLGFRLLNALQEQKGKVFFHGREKIAGSTDVNPNGLYTTVFAHTIHKLDDYASSLNSNFALVVDQHSARKELLECAAKTMYGNRPARRLVSPPFEVESHLNQTIQAADWIASIVGRMWAFRVQPEQYRDHELFEKYYAGRVAGLMTYSTVERRRTKEPKLVGLSPPTTLRYSVNDPAAAKPRGRV